MTVRLVIALELPDDDRVFEPIVDDHGVIDPPTVDELAGEFLEYASGFHTTARYQLITAERCTWHHTNDLKDPCNYCVQWRCATCKSSDWPSCCDDAQKIGGCEPYWPDGSVVPRVFDGCCERCTQAVAEYMELSREDGSLGST